MRHPSHGDHQSRDASSVLLSVVEDKKDNIFIFDFSGKEVESVEIKEGSVLDEYGDRIHNGSSVMEIIYDGVSVLKYVLPRNFKKKEVKYTFSNGILEVSLKK